MKFIPFFLILIFSNCEACPFCDSPVIEKQFVLEGSHLQVLYDNAPIIQGHLLIIPKRHVAFAHELSAEEWAEMHSILPLLIEAFKSAYHTDQYILLEKNGPFAGQTVSHVHFHLIPIPSKILSDEVKKDLFGKMFNIKPPKLDDPTLRQEIEYLKKVL